MNHGPYRLAPTFLYSEVSQDDWFRQNATQKEACVKKIRSARFSNSHYSNTASTSSIATPTQNPCQKSFGLLNAGITSAEPGACTIAFSLFCSLSTFSYMCCNMVGSTDVMPAFSKPNDF